jgi:hypothetical protein
MGRARKIYSKDDILRAMRHTRSIRAAARYLGCEYNHAKTYFKMYIDEETGKSLFDLHLNSSGIGIPKMITSKRKTPELEAILNGNTDPAAWAVSRIRDALIIEGYLAEECAICKFHERRLTDYKVPLLLNFKNGNKKHYIYENLELLCYNCYFLRVGNVFNDEQHPVIISQKDDSLNIYEQSPIPEEQIESNINKSLEENMREMGIEI